MNIIIDRFENQTELSINTILGKRLGKVPRGNMKNWA